MQFKSIEYIPKIEPDCNEILSLIYTPGVGYACKKIAENDGLSYLYTNRENSVAVISFNYEKSLKRAIFLKNTLNIDAIPFEVTLSENNDENLLKLIVENIYPNFCGIDLSLESEFVKNIDFDVEIPLLLAHNKAIIKVKDNKKNIIDEEKAIDINDLFKPFSKNIFNFQPEMLSGTFEENALFLREKAGGVIEETLSEETLDKPVVVLSDGSSVLGFGNIGAEAGLPVMEGKAVLFKSLGGVNSIPLCLKTQNKNEIIKITKALENSFSAINLEDFAAPKCFETEKELCEILNIPCSHDDQHGTAIVTLAALFNALSLVEKKINNIKIVISGAGASGNAVAKLLILAGAKNITLFDKDGILYKGRACNDEYLEELANLTNSQIKDKNLEEALKGADVFIGLSVGNTLNANMIKNMANKSIVFALANPIPEIMPEEALSAGAYIVATGRSDFANQINNSLAFPGLFKGILRYNIKKITNEILLECAFAIASTVKDEEISREHIIPNALDRNVVAAVVESLLKFA